MCLPSRKLRSEFFQTEIDSRGIAVGKRCHVGGDDTRRGEIMYVGEVRVVKAH